MPANTAQNAISMKRSAGEIFVSASEKRGDCPKISIIQTIFCKIQTVAGVQRRELWDMLNRRAAGAGNIPSCLIQWQCPQPLSHQMVEGGAKRRVKI